MKKSRLSRLSATELQDRLLKARSRLKAVKRANPGWRLRGIGPLSAFDEQMADLEQEEMAIVLELNRRNFDPGLPKLSENSESPSPGHLLSGNPDVVRRRAIVHQNSKLTAVGLCQLFDQQKVPLPRGLAEAGSWRNAYLAPESKHSVESIISKDRKLTK